MIRTLPTPWELTREALSVRDRKQYENMSLPELHRVWLEKIVEVLAHPELAKLVNEDKVTLAMVKPHDPEGWLASNGNIGAAYWVLDKIKAPLRVIFQISIWFSPEDVEEFYAGAPKKAQVGKEPIRGAYRNRWEEYRAYMSSGPATFLLLHSEKGGAMREWRKQIGHWNVQERREPGTIRGEFAKDNYTSIVHGSDRAESVLKEITFLRSRLLRFV
jgi:nucleoside diphosphate kinase